MRPSVVSHNEVRKCVRNPNAIFYAGDETLRVVLTKACRGKNAENQAQKQDTRKWIGNARLS